MEEIEQHFPLVLREAGEEGAGSGIPKVAGSGRKNYATLCNILQSKKCKGVGAKKYREGTGIKGYGRGEVYTPLSPPTVYAVQAGSNFTF